MRFAQLATKSSIRRRVRPVHLCGRGITALREHKPFECELHYGDRVERLTLAQLSIINAPMFGGSLDLRVPGARVDDRHLVVIAIEQEPLWKLLVGAVLTVAGGRRSRWWRARACGCRNLRVHVDRPLDVALDGEITARLPADFEVASGRPARDYAGRS